ncbi:hypothetical protein P167DRAFT_536990 [Morchella conica CCBAS932]|uniref:Uncharacterized protein n=1 Tax=Morchella conica CCBAS932 TaxID=1392247 RepID=A0A3N4KL55_9PEZI|nr:hypothetical protein P167DRAFT_536990 [Morchella conica CCBAS932]
MSYRKDNRTPGQIGGVDMVFPYRPDNVESSLIKKHPLQRIHSPSRSISAFVHVCNSSAEPLPVVFCFPTLHLFDETPSPGVAMRPTPLLPVHSYWCLQICKTLDIG